MEKNSSLVLWIIKSHVRSFFRTTSALSALLFAGVLLPALTFSQSYRSDKAYDSWIAFQTGSINTTDYHSHPGLSQNFIGLRMGVMDDRMPLEAGILYSTSGLFLDSEYYLQDHFTLGEGHGRALIVVGMPISFMGNPLYISGFDVTFGGGFIFRHPVGPVNVELRGEALTNFLSGLVYEDSGPGGTESFVYGRPFMLLLRLGGGVWYSVARSTELHVGVTHLDFRYWRMTSAVVAMTFEL